MAQKKEGWQPIKTAPRDGRWVTLLIPYDRTHFSEAQCTDLGYWQHTHPRDVENAPEWSRKDGGCWRFDGDDGMFDIQPTHWRPL